VMVPAIEIAEALGERRLANLVLLGALLERLPVLSLEAVGTALEKHIAARHRDMVQANLVALQKGAALARGEKVSA